MKLTESFKALWSNVVLKRGPEEVVDRKSYYITNAVLAFCIGFVLGLVIQILLATLPHDSAQLIGDILLYTILALAVAGNIYYLLPLFRSQEELWVKIVRPIVGCALFAAILLVGMFAFVVLITLLVIWLFLKILWIFVFDKSSSSSSEQKQDPYYTEELSDGTKLHQNDFAGEDFSGNDGHHYTKDSDGSYVRVD